MARLLFRDAQGRDGGIELGTEAVFIGRAVDCAIRTDDAMVSRKHSTVTFESGRYCIEDLNSSNKTYVNDVPVKKQALAHNDVVRCGSLWLRFVEDVPRAGGPSTVAFRASQPTAMPEQVAQQMAQLPISPLGQGNGNGAGGEDLRGQVAELTSQRDQAMQQARWMREEVLRRVRTMVAELDRLRAELEDMVRKLGGG